MITFARPGFLLAGALLALGPLILHLLTRRPNRPVSLPTARFVEPSPHTTLRFHRRPSDLTLLALRMLLLIVIGVAFAAPSRTAARRGSSTVVLLERAAGAAGADSARTLLADGEGALVVFDTAVSVFTGAAAEAMLDSISTSPLATGAGNGSRERGRGGSSLSAALAVLAGSDRLLPVADSARAVLIASASWGSWDSGVAAARAAWPGGIRVIEVEPVPAQPLPVLTAAPRTARVTGDSVGFARAALEALGYRVVEDVAGSADVVIILERVGVAIPADALLEAVRSGTTLVLGGVQSDLVPQAASPWRAQSDVEPGAPTPIDLGDGVLVSGAAKRLDGVAADDALVVARWLDGRAAAAARPLGDGCIVQFAAPLVAGTLPLDPAFPTLVGRLIGGCTDESVDDVPGAVAQSLDEGARQLLRGEEGAVALAGLSRGDGTGRSLVRVAFMLALLIAGIEAWLAYRPTTRRG